MTEAVPALLMHLLRGAAHEVRAVLHEDVVLHRADGSRVEGREAVAAALAGGAAGVRYEVVGTAEDSLVVEMSIEGVGGVLRFALWGRAEAGRLVEVRAGSLASG